MNRPASLAFVGMGAAIVTTSVAAADRVPLADASLLVEGNVTRPIGDPIAVADLDADGASDLLLGSAETGVRGEVFVVFGPASGTRDIGLGGVYVRVLGPRDAGFATSLAGGDANGDGLDDLVVGASAPGPTAAYLFYGPVTTDADTSDADITLLGLFGSGAGRVVTIGSDLDGDSAADLLIGAPNASAGDGKVYVVSGTAVGNVALEHDSTYVLEGGPLDRLGLACTDVGDVDGDGIGEVAVSAPVKNTVYVIQGGAAPGTLGVETAAAATITAPLGQFGTYLTKGDYDGDGAGDLFVEALYVKKHPLQGSGQVYAFLGNDLLAATTDVDAATTWTTVGVDNYGLGSSIAVGDVDGDADADVVMGAPFQGVAGQDSAVYLQTGFTSGTVDVRDLVRIRSTSEYMQLGASVGLVADWTGDGGAEVLVGAPGAGAFEGAAYVFASDLFY